MEDGRSLTEILLIAAFDPILIQEWVIHQSFFFCSEHFATAARRQAPF